MIFNLTTPAVSKLPKFTYTGTYTLMDDGGGNWRIKFLSSGKFTPAKDMTVDVFIVGGGGGGGSNGSADERYVASGGSGGYQTTIRALQLTAGTAYDVIVASGGVPGANGSASAFNMTTGRGGIAGDYSRSSSSVSAALTANGVEGASGSGGAYVTTSTVRLAGDGGSDGGDGSNAVRYAGTSSEKIVARGGTGQGTTTREFGEASGDLYSGGGAGTAKSNSKTVNGVGGAGGGGDGIDPGDPNTGGGGGGMRQGGSGIVIIRNARG